MQTMPLAKIKISDARHRAEFDPTGMAELVTSLEHSGLISPIILRSEDDDWHLVAGERRLRAVNLLHVLGKPITHGGVKVIPGDIPYLNFGDLNALQRQEIEYAENAYREDLTWQENVRAVERLHNLRTAQKAAVGESQTIQQTAEEIYKDTARGGNTDTVKNSLVVSHYMSNPAVAKATSLREATKIIKRIDENTRNTHLAGLQGTKSISDRFQCYQSEALVWMKDQPDDQFDVILTDPPYGIDAESFGDAAGRMSGIDHEYSDDSDSVLPLLSACFPEWFRLAKAQAHLYVWCDVDHFLTLRSLAREAGWWTFRTPLINVKPEGGRVPWPEHGPRRAYEICLYAVKGKRPTTGIRPDVFESRLTEGNFGHGAQKPVEAYVELLKRSARPGDRVLDTFAGTGTIFPAAHLLGLSAVGVEQAPAAFGICLTRLKELS